MSKKKDDKKRSERPQPSEAPGWGEDEHIYDDWDDLATDPPDPSRVERALEGILPDIVKKGVDGLISEDGLRSLVRDRGLPKEAVGFMIGQVDATKREVLRIVSKEMRLFLQNVDLGGELTKILTSVSFEIRTEVRFIPNDSAVKPDIKNKVRVRGSRSEEEEKEERGEEDEIADGPKEQQESSDESSLERDRGTSFRDRWRRRRRRREDEDEEQEETEAEQQRDSGDQKS